MAGHAPDRLDVGAASRGAARRGADAVGRLEASASEIRLGPLDETAVAQVARDMLGGEPDEALRQVLSRAGGQPFLLTELLRGLRAENLVTVDGGTAKLATGAQLPHRECLFSGIRTELRTVTARYDVRSESVRRSVCIDMKLTVQTFLTLDGVMQAPGGPQEDPSESFTHGGWQAPFPDRAVGEFVTELSSHASAFLFGRRTFDIFRGYWPDQTDPANPIATAINSLPKYVVSGSLSQADATWRGEHPDTARLVTGDVAAAVQALKDEPGDELQIWGSSQLLQTLLQHELVDRYRLMTFPLVLGSGRRLFNDGILPATMHPAGLTVTDLGIVIGTYEPAGPVRHGQM